MARYQARTDAVAWRIVDGEAVLVHSDSSAYFGLNRTGTILWEALLGGARSTEELLGALAPQIDALPQQARDQVEAFLTDLQRADLVQEASQGEESVSADPIRPSSAPMSEPPQLLPFGELEQLILSGE